MSSLSTVERAKALLRQRKVAKAAEEALKAGSASEGTKLENGGNVGIGTEQTGQLNRASGSHGERSNFFLPFQHSSAG